MSFSQPLPSSSVHAREAILELVEKHRKESNRKAKLSSVMRMAGLNQDKSKKPTDYTATDFFPPLPPETTHENIKNSKALKEIGNKNQTTARKSLNDIYSSSNNDKVTPAIPTTTTTTAAEASTNIREDTENNTYSKPKSNNKSSTTSNSSNLQPTPSVNQNESINVSHTINDDDSDENGNNGEGLAVAVVNKEPHENKENTHLQQISRVFESRKSATKTDTQLLLSSHLTDQTITNKTPQIIAIDNKSTLQRRSLASSIAAQIHTTSITSINDAQTGEKESERHVKLTETVNEILIKNSQDKTSPLTLEENESMRAKRIITDESDDSDDENRRNSVAQKLIEQQKSRNLAREKSKTTIVDTTNAAIETNEVRASTSKEKTTRSQQHLSSTLKPFESTGKSPKSSNSRIDDSYSEASQTPLRQQFNNSLKRRSHNLSQISEGSENRNENDHEEVFDFNEEDNIEIHGIEPPAIVATKEYEALLSVNETNTKGNKSKKNTTQLEEVNQASTSNVSSKNNQSRKSVLDENSKSPVSHNASKLTKAADKSKSLQLAQPQQSLPSPELPPPPPPPSPPPSSVVEAPAKKSKSSLKISKKNAPAAQPPPPTPASPQEIEPKQTSRISPPPPPPSPRAISQSQPTTSNLNNKLAKSISSSSISSQPFKKMTSRASLRNLEDANDSKDECELQALNRDLINRRSLTRSINNRTGNSTVSNASVYNGTTNGVEIQSASQLFKPKNSTSSILKPMPPLFNSESNKSPKTKSNEAKTKSKKATKESNSSTSNTNVDPYAFQNEMEVENNDSRQTSSRASRSRTRRSKDSNNKTPIVAATSSSNASKAKSSIALKAATTATTNVEGVEKTSGLKDMTNKPSEKRSKRILEACSPASSPDIRSKVAAKPSRTLKVPSEKENSKASSSPQKTVSSKKTSVKQKQTQKRKVVAPSPQSESDLEQHAAVALADDECPNGLRRSKRAKIGLGCHPKYAWEEMTGVDGNKVRVLCKVGFVSKVDQFTESSRNYIKQLEKYQAERNAKRLKEKKKGLKETSKKTPQKTNDDVLDQSDEVIEEAPRKMTKEEKKELKKKLKYEAKVRARKEEKRRLRRQESENEIRKEDGYTAGAGQDNVMNVDQQQQVDYSFSEKGQEEHASLELVSQYSESQINASQDNVIVSDQKTKTTNNQRLYLFTQNRKYQEIMPGVSVCIICKEQGVYCLEPKCCNSTSIHEQPINYHVEKGSVLCSINGTLSRHTVGDVIRVPKGARYKFKNDSPDSNAYIHFTFLSN